MCGVANVSFRSFVRGALLFTALGCARLPEDVAEDRQRIVGGELSGPEDDAVVRVSHPRMAVCNGALVAPNLVVTTRSCVSAPGEGGFRCSADGQLENGGGRGGELGSLYSADDFQVYAGAAGITRVAGARAIVATDSASVCADDLAFIVLDRSLEITPLAVRLRAATTVGEVMSVLGYGLSLLDNISQRRRIDDRTVLELDVPPRTFTLSPGACDFDGGGPALSADGAVTGVFSWRVGACDSPHGRNVFTRLSAFEDLALQAFARAGATPILDDASAELGVGSEAAGACAIGDRPAKPGAWALVLLALMRRFSARRRSAG